MDDFELRLNTLENKSQSKQQPLITRTNRLSRNLIESSDADDLILVSSTKYGFKESQIGVGSFKDINNRLDKFDCSIEVMNGDIDHIRETIKDNNDMMAYINDIVRPKMNDTAKVNDTSVDNALIQRVVDLEVYMNHNSSIQMQILRNKVFDLQTQVQNLTDKPEADRCKRVYRGKGLNGEYKFLQQVSITDDLTVVYLDQTEDAVFRFWIDPENPTVIPVKNGTGLIQLSSGLYTMEVKVNNPVSRFIQVVMI